MDNISGIGLYADNVFLNGSLITKSSTGNNAGVNTISGITAKKFGNTDNSPIIFWAGAMNTEEVSI